MNPTLRGIRDSFAAMASLTESITPAEALRARITVRQLIGVAACLVMLGVGMFLPQLLNDGDTYWHIATGEWMLAHHQVPTVDPFSFTHFGKPWVAHEWLSELIMVTAYNAGGWSGFMVLFGLSLALTTAMMLRTVGRHLGGVSLIVALVLGWSMTGSCLLARPQLISLPLIAFWTGELLAAREANRAPPLWMAGLMVLWANLHGSFVFGYLLAAPIGLEALWENRRDPWPVLRDWGVFGLACVGAALLTPHGIEGLIYPFQIMTMKDLNSIVEWRPTDFTKLGEVEIVILATVFICLMRGVKVPPLRLALLIFILHMALQHRRHELVLGVIGPIILAEPIARALGQRAVEPVRNAAPYILFAAVALVMLVVRFAEPRVRVDAITTPKTALEHVPAALQARPVVNTYSFGGYLIYKGVRPFMDGRSDMYGDALFSRHIKIVAGDQAAFDQAVKQYGIDWTILSPNEGLNRMLATKAGWKQLYRDRWAVVYARTAALDAALARPAVAQPALQR